MSIILSNSLVLWVKGCTTVLKLFFALSLITLCLLDSTATNISTCLRHGVVYQQIFWLKRVTVVIYKGCITIDFHTSSIVYN